MIHHVSIPAHEPRRVAEALAELMGGRCSPFVQLDGAFRAESGDAHGTMIEVYPEAATLVRPAGDGPVAFGANAAPPRNWPFHLLLSVSLSREEIERIGHREGWRTNVFGRGPRGQPPVYYIIEFWLENRLMLEVMPQEMAREYEEHMQPRRRDAVSAAQ